MPRVQNRREEPLTDETSLSVAEQHFLANYIKLGNLVEAVKATSELRPEGKTYNALALTGQRLMKKPHIQAEYNRAVNEARQNTMATATEVLEYFTKVMRGEEKDQFGLDAPLSERTKAAQELAKRTVDIENRRNGESDQRIEIVLDWSRK